MKKSILTLSLILPMTLAHGGEAKAKATPAPSEVAPVAATVSIEPAASEDKPVSVTVTTAAPVKAEEKSLLSISSADMKDASIALDLSAEKIGIVGSLPKECADRLSLSDVKTFASTKTEEELKEANLEKADDLKEYSSSVEAQVTFAGDKDSPGIRDCLSKYKDSPRVDLKTDPRFSRTVFTSPTMAVAGLTGEVKDVKSPEFIKFEKQIAKLDCKDCNSNWKLLKGHLEESRGFKSPLLESMMAKLFEGALTEMDTRIEGVTSLSALAKLREELIEMGKYASSDEQRGLHGALFMKLIDKNSALAADGKKTASAATKHVDFEKDTYSKMLGIPGLPEEERAELKERVADLQPGKTKRLQMLSSLDGDHPEIRQYLRGESGHQQQLVAQMNSLCTANMNQYQFTQCGELQNELKNSQTATGELASRYSTAHNEAWGGIFSRWDQKNVAYDQNWKTTFMQPIMQSSQSNALPLMYDPRDPKYKNFDGSALYESNPTIYPNNGSANLSANNQPNDLYSVQNYSVTPPATN